MSNAADSFPPGFVLTGGVPLKGQDFAASILFIIAFALLVPLVSWRLFRKSSRTWVLVRPAIFIAIRIATYVVRAIQADGNVSKGLFITEQICLLCGFLLLLEPFSALVKYNLYRHWVPDGKRKHSLSRLLLLIRIAVFAAIDLGIYIGVRTSSAMKDPKKEETLRQCRWAAGGIALGIVVLSLSMVIYAQIRGCPDRYRTGYLGTLGTCLLVPCVYRLVLYAHPTHPFSPAGKAIYYLFSSLPELVAVILFLSINLETTFEIKEGCLKDEWASDVKKGKVEGTYRSPYGDHKNRHEAYAESRGSHEMYGKEVV